MAATTGPRGLLILDRDGVINRDSAEFVKNNDEFQPLPGSIEAIAELSQAGFTGAMHRKLRRLVAGAGGRIDRIVVCPHGPDDGCDCRKPAPGLLLRLADHYGVSLDGAPAIGDSLRDLQAAEAAGARPILVRTGNGGKTEAALRGSLRSIEVFDDLAGAAHALVKS